ncbi:MAG: DUF2298 domain-containing protein [Chloroflexi bacterium]|nr:DUF2298 domain-containing protein [Chloroflexota bacterium]MDA1228519.1 DUF2298 domain-containing protein [Chloroflexota bacterium]
MLDALWWLIAAEAMGLIAFPLAYFLLPRLADRGYTLSKPLGILIIGYLSWVLSVLHILPSVRISLIGLLIAFGALSGWYAWNHRQELIQFAKKERRAIIIGEAIFLAFLIGWTIYRSVDPYINHTEQPMDFALLNASIQSTFGQPEDPWLRGEAISYYYFGYWMMGSLSQITGLASAVSYNLSLALIPAMAAMGVFGLGYNMIKAERIHWGYAIAGGVGGAVMVGLVANLEGVLEFMRFNAIGSQGFWDWLAIDGLAGPATETATSWMPQDFWWWFRATRVINTFQDGVGIDYTIQEFPMFSYVLGDMHPHVMSIPFAVMFLGICLNFLRTPIVERAWTELRSYAFILVTALVLGGLAFTNMWDLPTYGGLFIAAAAFRIFREKNGSFKSMAVYAGPTVLAVFILVYVLYAPYFLNFQAGVNGLGAVETTTRGVHLFVIWGLFLVAVVPFMLATLWQTTVREDWRRLSAIALSIAFVPWLLWAALFTQGEGGMGDLIGRFFHVLPFSVLITIGVYNTIWLARDNTQTGKLFAMALATTGLLLIMGPELLFIRDFFESRMNSIFKLYYQAWLLLAVASGFAIYQWQYLRISLMGWRRSLTTLWAVAFIALLAGSLYYSPAAIASKSELSLQNATLDGLKFTSSAEYEAIAYLRTNAESGSGIVEGVGEWFDWALISRSTGLPTVFNWPGHQIQWRGTDEKFAGREADVARIYESLDASETQNLLNRYDVDYVYVSLRERDKYGTEGLEKFSSFMDTVFQQDDVIIYRMRE